MVSAARRCRLRRRDLATADSDLCLCLHSLGRLCHIDECLKHRLKIFLVLTLLAFAAACVRLGQLQLFGCQDYRREADRMLVKPELLPTVRGKILDRKDRELAMDVASYDLCLDFGMIEMLVNGQEPTLEDDPAGTRRTRPAPGPGLDRAAGPAAADRLSRGCPAPTRCNACACRSRPPGNLSRNSPASRARTSWPPPGGRSTAWTQCGGWSAGRWKRRTSRTPWSAACDATAVDHQARLRRDDRLLRPKPSTGGSIPPAT